jgi:hypothetical protein
MIKVAPTTIVSLLLILLANPGATIVAESPDKSAKDHWGAFPVRVQAVDCKGGCSMACRSVCQPGGECSPLVCCWEGASSCWTTTHNIE